jgi:uncharacterized membrane protein YgaE (UPF0421/DUF939 family)
MYYEYRAIIEQQYAHGVAIILRCRQFQENYERQKATNNNKNTNNDINNKYHHRTMENSFDIKITEIMKKMIELGNQLADKIKQSLLRLPTSPVSIPYI